MAKQPWGITLAAVLLAIGGATTTLSALTMIFLGTALAMIGTTLPIGAVTTVTILMGLLYFALGLAYFAVAYFLYFKHNNWAWGIAFILTIIGIISGLTSVIALSIIGILMLVLNNVVIIGLLQPKARKICKVKFE